ncbi:Uncharacterized protein dnm_008290 [Desulfonema magnum]|uniref:Uncharacterized protein n=1 Tax=Desulfonema magnum TaxID=45655 RepID=A0A975BGF1_9BACT|nr:Uncharacterized protein dnm_008290 [Desulfonema magnum]
MIRSEQKACHFCKSRNDRKKLEHRVIVKIFDQRNFYLLILCHVLRYY